MIHSYWLFMEMADSVLLENIDLMSKLNEAGYNLDLYNSNHRIVIYVVCSSLDVGKLTGPCIV